MAESAGSARAARVFTIPAGVSFVDALALRVLSETAADPLALSNYTILLPTRRARRALSDAFLRQSDGRPLLLPRIMPLGDLDPDEFGIDEVDGPVEGASEVAGQFAELPPPIPSLRRQLLLTQAVQAARGSGAAPANIDQAARLAAELARFLDQVQTEQVPFERLKDLVPEAYAQHWQITLRFLEILVRAWPNVLAAEGCVDSAVRRNQLLMARAETWLRKPPADPVIAAGSTGSIPATAQLLHVIAGLPSGRVVLPGLDRDTDEETWAAIGEDPAHPQHGLWLLLKRLELAPSEVLPWPAVTPRATQPSRARLVAEALRPAATTASWQRLAGELKRDKVARDRFELSLNGIARVDCPGPQDEAAVIALALREALDTGGKRAALVTPDRGLARRVAAELRRWDLDIDDSAGQPLADTPPGAFLRLTADLLVEDIAPVPLLAVLKHPLAAGGRDAGAFRALARQLDVAVRRGLRPAPGFDGLRRALRGNGDHKELTVFVDKLAQWAAPFAALIAKPDADFLELLAAHVGFAEAMAASDLESGARRLWAGDAGTAAATFVAELRQAASGFQPFAGRRYPALLETLLSSKVVRPHYGRHPRLAIWGPLEARLQHVELLVLGGLNEGIWPAEPTADPWLSRPMRRVLGLPAPERRIGLAAHDFAQALGAREIMLTRSTRVEGTPTVPSRWLLRLDGLLRTLGFEPERLHGGKWLHWQMKLDQPARVRPVDPPAPRPPVGKRPREMRVTQVETWRRDPYAIYAKWILRLEALDPLDAAPGAADRGTQTHKSLEHFVRQFPDRLPADALDQLLAIGRQCFGELLDRPAVRAFWWPRFERIAAWYIEQERARRPGLAAIHAEVKGTLLLDGPLGPFRLTGTADRIEQGADGKLRIIDYKTGTLPKPRDIDLGMSPQLALEAAIAAAGGFEGMARGETDSLAFWKLSGADPPGFIEPVKDDPMKLAREALDGLRQLVRAFDRAETPYRSLPDPTFAPRFSDYAHLARVKEWSAGAAGDGE